MANPKITSTGFVGNLIGTASFAANLDVVTISGKTVETIREALKAAVCTPERVGKFTVVKCSGFSITDFVAKWNSNAITETLEDGTQQLFLPIATPLVSSGGYGAWIMGTYAKESQYIFTLTAGSWSSKIDKVSTSTDLTEIKAQITSASANYASKSHSHTASDITDLSSAIDTELSTSVTASNPTLSFGSTSTIGTIAGKNLEVTMPSDPTKGQFSAVSSSAATAATWVKNNSASIAEDHIELNTVRAVANRVDGTLDNVMTGYKMYSGSYSPLPPTVDLAANTCYDIYTPTSSFAMTLPTGSDSGDYQKKYSIAVRIGFGNTVPAITWPSGVYWANGEAPTLEAGTVCEANFMYCAGHWCVAYQSFKEATA